MGSTMWGYYNYGDEKTFLYNFRMTKDQLEGGHRMLAEGGHLHDSQSRHVEYRFPGRFKFAVCMYVFAHGGGAGTYFKAAADCASLGESTVERWMGQFCSVGWANSALLSSRETAAATTGIGEKNVSARPSRGQLVGEIGTLADVWRASARGKPRGISWPACSVAEVDMPHTVVSLVRNMMSGKGNL